MTESLLSSEGERLKGVGVKEENDTERHTILMGFDHLLELPQRTFLMGLSNGNHGREGLVGKRQGELAAQKNRHILGLHRR